jgi:hypothetical protein
MAAVSKVTTNNSGQAYIDECIDAGVPVPSTVNDTNAGWDIVSASITEPFMEPDFQDARLWWFENRENMPGPDGICMSLPRGEEPGPDAEVFGVICMGWNGNTCYFTNHADDIFPLVPDLNDPILTAELAGGTDLVGAPEGECTNCHAGENPFIIHPDDPAFVEVMASVSRVFPDAWPTPIVPEEFVGNPEPLDQLGPVTNLQLRCDSCHQQGASGGRLPLVSTAYDEYCSGVLAPALGEVAGIPATMPRPGHGELPDYADHVAWLSDACDIGAAGGVVPFVLPTAPNIRPPDVDPPFICSKRVRVSNAVYGATLRLYIDNILKASGVFRDPKAGYVFTLGSQLTAGTVVQVSQQVGAITSTRTTLLPLDHTAVYQDGLPPPIISPVPLYECASSIAVMNVPGAELTVVKTPPGGTAKTYTITSGHSHTWISGLGNPAFAINTALKVRQKLCTETTPYSPSSVVANAPAALPDLTFDPPLVVGQPVVEITSITQGARVRLTEGATQVYDNPSVPYNSWRQDVTASLPGPVGVGDHLIPVQTLCDVNSDEPDHQTPLPCNTASLVPKIAPPHAGDRFVLLTYSVPGSNVRVFDSLGTELGNGSGIAVDLSRALVANELIKVGATLPGCAAVNNAFAIIVSG